MIKIKTKDLWFFLIISHGNKKVAIQGKKTKGFYDKKIKLKKEEER